MSGLALALAGSIAIAVSPDSVESSVRYALVIGNNVGSATETSLPPLEHAEREAAKLHQRLIQYGGFAPERTILVTGAGRDEILAAVKQLAARRRQDSEEVGAFSSLFALFFTGHGLAGKLLTPGEPLEGEDLAAIFQQMDASLTVGFFDACFSGTFNLEQLTAKGVRVMPGFNPVTELPQEVLNSEGTMWFVSSQGGEASYEDRELGGLFTHFFIEAFTAAPDDGVGTTLEEMWNYARARTRDYTQQYGRDQTPQKLVRRLKTSGPLYFSFRGRRDAAIEFHEDVSGVFVITHKNSGLVEKVIKGDGEPLVVTSFSGPILVARADEPRAQTRLDLPPGGLVLVRPESLERRSALLGYGEAPIRSKGELPGLALMSRESVVTVEVSGGYRYLWSNHTQVGVSHKGVVGAAVSLGRWRVGLDIGLGRESGQFTSWSLRQDELELALAMAVTQEVGAVRLEASARAAVLLNRIHYEGGGRRTTTGSWLGAGARVLLPVPWGFEPVVVIAPEAHAGLLLAQGLARGDGDTYRLFAPSFGVSVIVPLSR